MLKMRKLLIILKIYKINRDELQCIFIFQKIIYYTFSIINLYMNFYIVFYIKVYTD